MGEIAPLNERNAVPRMSRVPFLYKLETFCFLDCAPAAVDPQFFVDMFYVGANGIG
jgi:hypothetical protein